MFYSSGYVLFPFVIFSVSFILLYDASFLILYIPHPCLFWIQQADNTTSTGMLKGKCRVSHMTDSLMHYGAYAFAINRNVPVIEPRDSSISISRLGQRDKLSPYDIMQVNIRYCPGMDVTVSFMYIYMMCTCFVHSQYCVLYVNSF